VVLRAPLHVLALVTVIIVGKSCASFVLMRAMGQSTRSALFLGGSLAQIGEFSFIVTGMGVSLGLLARDTQALVVAAALLAITVNPPLLTAVRALLTRAMTRRAVTDVPVPLTARATHAPIETTDDPFDFSRFHDHVVVIGHGRVGTTVTEALQREQARYVIVDEQERVVAGLRARGERAVYGDATRVDVQHRAGVEHARLIVVTAPEPIRARRTVEVARELNPQIAIAVRTHSAAEQAFFEEIVHMPGATGRAIYAEREAALSLAHFALQTLGRTDDEADLVIDAMRNTRIAPTETFAALHTREFRAMMAPDPNHPAQHGPDAR
jgi:monovalent cation:H+ antiporter-2, CPA2 family